MVWNRQYEAYYAESSMRTYKTAKNRGYNINYSKNMGTIFNWEKYHAAVNEGKIKNPKSLKLV